MTPDAVRIEREVVWLTECECALLRGQLAGDPEAAELLDRVRELQERYAWGSFTLGHEL